MPENPNLINIIDYAPKEQINHIHKMTRRMTLRAMRAENPGEDSSCCSSKLE